MFTGLIQHVGTLVRLSTRSTGAHVTIRCGGWDEPLSIGESIAVQGACLSVTRVAADEFDCDVLSETLERTNFRAKRPGALLNLERSLRASDRLDGHIVTGHVDGQGSVLDVSRAGDDRVIRVGCGSEVLDDIVLKGSVACDGVSLTVAGLDERAFAVHIIPLTWQNTSVSALIAGDSLNIETDIVGKYVRRQLGRDERPGRVTVEMLRNSGFPV